MKVIITKIIKLFERSEKSGEKIFLTDFKRDRIIIFADVKAD